MAKGRIVQEVLEELGELKKIKNINGECRYTRSTWHGTIYIRDMLFVFNGSVHSKRLRDTCSEHIFFSLTVSRYPHKAGLLTKRD
jgi:hypothetical protein